PGKYQAIEAKDIPDIVLDEHGSHLRVIAGEYADAKGAASTFSPLNVWDGKLVKGQKHTLYVPEGHTTLVVVLEGAVVVNDTNRLEGKTVAILSREGVEFSLNAEEDTKFLVLTGQPLNEPIEGYGPFVMNTKAEIMEAINDFNRGKFGSIMQEG
ncbi:pirin-like C-terminal cupin domain-containing protein, partial [Acinetobacter baumannii]